MSVSLASSLISSSVFPSNRSTALLNTTSGLDAIFTFAIASTLSGMFPLENALFTVISSGIVSRFKYDTVSMSGMRIVRPPVIER